MTHYRVLPINTDLLRSAQLSATERAVLCQCLNQYIGAIYEAATPRLLFQTIAASPAAVERQMLRQGFLTEPSE